MVGGKARVEEATRALQREEHQAVARVWEETLGSAAHESSAYRDCIGMVAISAADEKERGVGAAISEVCAVHDIDAAKRRPAYLAV